MRFSWIPLLSLVLAATPASLNAQRTIEPAIPSAEDAPIALLVDLTSGQTLFARDPDRRFMPASITKVMTAFLAFELMEDGRLFPEQVMTIRPDTFDKWNRVGSTMFLPADARVTVDELLHGITTVSANDASVVLAEGASGSVADWTTLMNAKARELGMRDSHFNTPNGWMDEGRTFTSARDLVTLASAMIKRHPSKYRHFIGAAGFEYNGITQRNHDPISGVVPGADGIKTGFTNQSGYGFLGSAQRDGRRLVMVVATSPRARLRNAAARSFIEWGFTQFDTRALFAPRERITLAEVQGGGVRSVGLRAPGPIQVAVPRGTRPEISLTVKYEGPLRAPIREGEEVAQMLVRVEGMPEYSIPLYAENDVFGATVVQRIINGLTGWI